MATVRQQALCSWPSSLSVSLDCLQVCGPLSKADRESSSPVRLAGNVLLVFAHHQNYSNSNVVEWGYICQGLGYTFFLSATLSFYQRAKDPNASMAPSNGRGLRALLANPSPAKALQLVTLIGLILLITGYTDSTGIFPSASSTGVASDSTATLNVKAKVGDCIFLAVTAVIAVLTATSYRSAQTSEAKNILRFIFLALPFMSVRMIYVTYQSFTKHPFDRTLWAKVLFDYAMEVIVVAVYFILGFVIARISPGQDLESGTGYKPDYDAPTTQRPSYSGPTSQKPSYGGPTTQLPSISASVAPIMKKLPIIRHFN